MRRYKILWFSNCRLANRECAGTGSWLFAMKNLMVDKIDLYNITQDEKARRIVVSKEDKFTEYVLPKYRLFGGLPLENNVLKINRIVDEIAPDIIHIWGVEAYWSTLFVRNKLSGNALLELQGIMSSIYNVFWAGLSPREIRRSYGIKDILKPSDRLSYRYKIYQRMSEKDHYVNSFKWVSTQSGWTRNQIRIKLDSDTKVFNSLRPLRKEFFESEKWKGGFNDAPVIYTSASYFYPHKGLHILIKALSLVAKRYPETKLIIAGLDISIPWYREKGYIRFLKKTIREYGLGGNVSYPGRLNAKGIIDTLLSSDVYVNPSFVESFSAATAEALCLGVPSVLSYAGAMPEFNDADNPVASYYSPMDYVICAHNIIELFENHRKAKTLSGNAINKIADICAPEKVVQTQMSIYEAIQQEYNESTNTIAI